MKTISFHTLGCRLNQSETMAIENSFPKAEYTVVDFHKPSDIAVINTCTVTEKGDADTRHLVHTINRLNPQTKIALIGCQAQIQKEALAVLPNVRWIVGNGRKMDLATVLREDPNPTCVAVITPTIERKPFVSDTACNDSRHTRANIKIQDGCDFFCSFCEIPYARGRARSRVFENILKETKILVDAGHQELVLTGINIGTYAYEDKTLMDVIQAMQTLERLKRVRISSIEPTTIPPGILKYMQTDNKLCRYLHIPLQSGDDVILKDMRRQYTCSFFRELVMGAFSQVPQIGLGTDVIVGFPSETAAHFDNTLSLLEELPLAYMHVFAYSPRYKAKSHNQPSLDSKIIAKRSHVLRELSRRKQRLFYASLLGTVQEVLFEHPKESAWQNGLSDNYVRVHVSETRNLYNQILPVILDHLEADRVIGRLLV